MHKCHSKINQPLISNISTYHCRKFCKQRTLISPDFIFILWGQSTWILVKAFQERGGSEGRGREGSVKTWKAGRRITLLVHAPNWWKNAEYRKYSKFVLIYILAKSSFAVKKHINRFSLSIYSSFKGSGLDLIWTKKEHAVHYLNRDLVSPFANRIPPSLCSIRLSLKLLKQF